MEYGIVRRVDLGVEEALERVTAELAKEGFGVLTRIDVQKTLKEKLGEDTRPYVILGACNPQMAHRALQAEKNLGLLLPCNVVVYQDDEDATVVAAIDAASMLGIVENERLAPVADAVGARLRAVLERV